MDADGVRESARELSCPFPELEASPQYRDPGTQGSQAAGVISPSTESALCHFSSCSVPFEDLAVILLCTPQLELNSHVDP